MTKLRKLSAILLSVLLVVSALPFYAAADEEEKELTLENIGKVTAECSSSQVIIDFSDSSYFGFSSCELLDSTGSAVSVRASGMPAGGVRIRNFSVDSGTYTLVFRGVQAEYADEIYVTDEISFTCIYDKTAQTFTVITGPQKPELSISFDGSTALITVTNYTSIAETENTVYMFKTAGKEPVAVTGTVNKNTVSFDLSSFSRRYGEAEISADGLNFIGSENGDYLKKGFSAVIYINNNGTFTADFYHPFAQSGTQDDPYIVNEKNLPYLSDFCLNTYSADISTVSYFRLSCDIDNVSEPFAEQINNAVFDGDGHKVTLNYSGGFGMSLFGYVGNNAVVKNLVIDGKVEATHSADGIANHNFGLIYNCTSYADLSVTVSNSVCSLVGGNYGKVINCDNRGSLSALAKVSGIVSVGGVNFDYFNDISYNSIIENCFAACDVNSGSAVGGIVYQDNLVDSGGDNCVINHCFYDRDLMGGNVIAVNTGYTGITDSRGLSTYECKNGLVDELNSYVANSDIEDLAEWIVGPDGYPTLNIITKFPAEEHNFSADWSYDKDAHWHECTDEECSIEDYAVCELSGAAYGEHIDSDEDGICDVCNVGWITSTNTVLKSGKWIVDSNVFCFDTLTVDGDIEIYLEDMCTLNALGGIVVPANCKLTVNAESANSDCGSLIAMGKPGAAGIGGTADDEETVEIEGGCGTIIINGGKINAVGGSGAAGIGGGYASESGSVTVNDAVLLQAMGYVAIGEGENAPDLCRITINTDLAVEAGENQYDITALTYTDEAYVRITNIHGTDYICGIADVSCGFEGEVEITITDVSDGSIVYEGSTDGSNVYYIDGTVAEGTYLLEASSYDAVTRTYTVTVGSEKELAEVELYTEGDVNGDGEIDEYDYQQAVNIALSGDNILSKTGDLSDDADYSLAVADADCDGVVDVLDIAMLERKIFA